MDGVRLIGPDGAVLDARVDLAADGRSLIILGEGLLAGQYSLQLDGGPAGLADIMGCWFDGDADGYPGGRYEVAVDFELAALSDVPPTYDIALIGPVRMEGALQRHGAFMHLPLRADAGRVRIEIRVDGAPVSPDATEARAATPLANRGGGLDLVRPAGAEGPSVLVMLRAPIQARGSRFRRHRCAQLMRPCRQFPPGRLARLPSSQPWARCRGARRLQRPSPGPARLRAGPLTPPPPPWAPPPRLHLRVRRHCSAWIARRCALPKISCANRKPCEQTGARAGQQGAEETPLMAMQAQAQQIGNDDKARDSLKADGAVTPSVNFLADWIAALVAEVPGADRLVVMVEDAAGESFRPAALWPDPAADLTDLSAVIAAAAGGAPALDRRADGGAALARPVPLGGHVAAIVALSLRAGGDSTRADRRLAMATGWLAVRLREQRAGEDSTRYERGFAALDLLAVIGAQPGLPAAALAFVNEIVARLPFARAALGLVRNPDSGDVRLLALSGAAWFRKRGMLVAAHEDAMGEAADQRATILWPLPDGRARMIDAAHAALAAARGSGDVASVVMFDEEVPIAVLTVEGDCPIVAEDLNLIEAVAALAGPVMALKAQQNRLIAGKMRDKAGQGLRALTGWNRPSYRLAALALIVVLAAPFVITGPFNIVADARVEGAVERASTAPFAGYIAEAPARAGDRVAAGALLLRLDNRDLLLEAERWRSDVARLTQESRQALAGGALAELRLTEARFGQAQAQLALAVGRLDRTELRAAVVGVVLSGDHAARIGAPVEVGELLFTLSPLDRFRIVLEIDERDLALVGPGSTGALALQARGGARIPLTIDTLTPVVRGDEGRRLFRAEATPGAGVDTLFPGLEGVARIYVDDRPYAEIWTRRLRDWVTLQLWRWAP